MTLFNATKNLFIDYFLKTQKMLEEVIPRVSRKSAEHKVPVHLYSTRAAARPKANVDQHSFTHKKSNNRAPARKRKSSELAGSGPNKKPKINEKADKKRYLRVEIIRGRRGNIQKGVNQDNQQPSPQSSSSNDQVEKDPTVIGKGSDRLGGDSQQDSGEASVDQRFAVRKRKSNKQDEAPAKEKVKLGDIIDIVKSRCESLKRDEVISVEQHECGMSSNKSLTFTLTSGDSPKFRVDYRENQKFKFSCVNSYDGTAGLKNIKKELEDVDILSHKIAPFLKQTDRDGVKIGNAAQQLSPQSSSSMDRVEEDFSVMLDGLSDDFPQHLEPDAANNETYLEGNLDDEVDCIDFDDEGFACDEEVKNSQIIKLKPECQAGLDDFYQKEFMRGTAPHSGSSDQICAKSANSNLEDSSNPTNEENYRVKSQSTVGDGNCFFHAVFGTLCEGKYKAEKAQEMREEWCKFLSQFKSLEDKENSMPQSLKERLKQIFRNFIDNPSDLIGKEEELGLLIKECNTVDKNQLYEQIKGSEKLYELYLSAIMRQDYYVFIEEIPILASLADIKIDLCGFGTIEPNKDLLKHFIEQSSSSLKSIENSPTRKRNRISPGSPGKENRLNRVRFCESDSGVSLLPSVVFTPHKRSDSIESDQQAFTTSTPKENEDLGYDGSLRDGSGKKFRKPNHPKKKKSARRKLIEDDEFNCSEQNSMEQDLAEDDAISQEQAVKQWSICSPQELEDFFGSCKSGGKIAIYKDNKVSLSCNKDEVYYIDEKFKQNALKEINGLLSSGKVKKVIVYDIKEVIKTFPAIESVLDSVDDLKVMSYSLNTRKNKCGLQDIVERNFNRIEETFSAGTLIKIHNELEPRLDKQSETLRKIYDELDKPLTEVIINMEKKGVKVDAQKLQGVSERLKNQIETLEKEIYKLAGVKFKIGSPEKLKGVLFNRMKLLYRTGLNGLWYRETDSRTLRECERRGTEIAGKVLSWRSLSKLKSNIDGICKACSSGRIHANFSTTGTTIGRLSSSNPNLQNIPIRDKEANLVRQAFIAEEGHKLISADYLQMELRILAEIANVEKLKEAFKEGKDIHETTARKIFNISENEEVKDEDRQKAKTINFGIIYGMSAHSLAIKLGITTQEADEYMKSFFSSYPEIKTYMREAVIDARAYGYVETKSGRRLNTEYINSKIIPLKEHVRRFAVNARIQGTGADIMRLAMVKLSKELKEKELGELILTIHDELIVEAKDENVDEVKKLMQKVMEKTAQDVLGAPTSVKTKVGNDLNFGRKYQPMENVSSTKDQLMETDFREEGLMEEDESHEEEIGDLINYDLEDEKYRNSFFDITGIAYQVEVSILCAHRAFKVHKRTYKDIKISTEESQDLVGKFDDLTIRYKNKGGESKTINVQIKRIDQEEGYNDINCSALFPKGEEKEKGMFAIVKYFHSFLKQDVEERNKVEYNVIYTNSDFATKDGRKLKSWFSEHSGIEVDQINIKEEEKYGILKDLLCADEKKRGLYKFSQEAREKVSQLLEPLSLRTKREVFRELRHLSLERKGKIKRLLESPSKNTKREVKKLLEPLEKRTKAKILRLLKPLFDVAENYEKLKGLKEEFLDKLVFAVNQPSRQELKQTIEKDSGDYCNKLREKMFDWLEQSGNQERTCITKEVYSEWCGEQNRRSTNIDGTSEQNIEKYTKSQWVAAMVPRVRYNLELFTFYIHRAFSVHKEDYKIKIRELRASENNYVCFDNNDKCSCIYSKNKDIREGSKKGIFTSINDHFNFFLKLHKKGKKVEHFVVSVVGLDLQELDFVGETEKITHSRQKGGFLQDFLCKNGRFYQYSEKIRKEFLNKLEPMNKKEKYKAKDLKNLKEEFLEKLVFAVKQLERKELESSIKAEAKDDYNNYREVALRWLESEKGMSIDEGRVKKYLDNIKEGETTKFTYGVTGRNKELISSIDSFARGIVGRKEARRFRELKVFLCGKGVDKFEILEKKRTQSYVSSMLLGVGEDAVSAFNKLYDKLFDKKGKESEFLKSFTSGGITLGNVSSMLNGAGSDAPQALESLINILTGKTINGKTYLEFLKDKGINVSSMLNGAGSDAPQDLELLIEILTDKTINGKTYLEFLKDKGIISNVSSMLHGAGSNAPEALEVLIKTLNKKIEINGKKTTYLQFLKSKGIISNVSSMLSGAGSDAPQALESLIEILTDKTINGKTYLEFLKDKGIISNVSSMLSGAGSNAPQALEKLVTLLNSNLPGQQTTYLEFLKDKDINVSSMLSGAGSNAPQALEKLVTTLTKERNINGGKTTYLEFLKDKGIVSNVSSMLSGA
ncbi:PREDICTED: uncharacterized protein LOC105556307 [Vollenhovia emeryi]|uniref:uncharacterized protein LOC105556307 n=1 Tax=Vollenhovia emeryi TaxID=411798 RepID=UPI0005F3F22B|nr:PREDICTED: uncharacterized protein LOC105556307 [Vollenhovia emeryi]